MLSSQVLLQTTRELFRDTSSLEVMMGKIMEQAHHLVPCEKVELLLVEEQTTDSEVQCTLFFIEFYLLTLCFYFLGHQV